MTDCRKFATFNMATVFWGIKNTKSIVIQFVIELTIIYLNYFNIEKYYETQTHHKISISCLPTTVFGRHHLSNPYTKCALCVQQCRSNKITYLKLTCISNMLLSWMRRATNVIALFCGYKSIATYVMPVYMKETFLNGSSESINIFYLLSYLNCWVSLNSPVVHTFLSIVPL